MLASYDYVGRKNKPPRKWKGTKHGSKRKAERMRKNMTKIKIKNLRK
jgi:hypothetical protein